MIADYLPGLWDQHGKGRADGGVLDDLFGVKHSPDLKAADVFGGKLWCEVDQDANFSWKTYAGVPHQGKHLHQGRERLRQGRAQHGRSTRSTASARARPC